MEIIRTANAGVLIKADDTEILIDGVCEELKPYKGTPCSIKKELLEKLPDAFAYTHTHKDHYDNVFADEYKKDKIRSVIGPDLSDFLQVGDLSVYAIPTRHIGKNDVPHVSFVLKGSKCVWFMGDASPAEIKKITGFPKPDILIVPFAYVNTKSSLEQTKSFNAVKIIVLHMPDKENDEFGLWEAVEKNCYYEENIIIPEIGEKVDF